LKRRVKELRDESYRMGGMHPIARRLPGTPLHGLHLALPILC
jgi:hypothetical protein